MKSVAQILKSKADHAVHTIGPEASVYEAIAMMAELNIGALVVLENDAVVGIITERDYARKIVLLARSSKSTPVRDIMTTPATCVAPEADNEACMALMTNLRTRHLPVVEEGRLVGIVSIGDIVKDIISDQEFIIDQLEHYISGSRL